MNLANYLNPKNVIVDLDPVFKDQALQMLSVEAETPTRTAPDRILEALRTRERLGSTGIGLGVAIPHTRIAGLEEPVAILARLQKPIEFDAIDDLPVDIILLLLTPDQECNKHLSVLACFSRKLRTPGVLERMRAADNPQVLYESMTTSA
jgi:nitrogen PTS system EIIA component